MSTDAELIISYLQDRQEEVINELLRRHMRSVWATVHAMVLNSADADDLTQEIFLRAFRALPTFQGHAAFSTWLYSIAMNVTRSFLSDRRRKRADNTGFVDARDPTGSADEVAIRNELTDDVALALKGLSVPLRAAVVLNMQGFSAKEAATTEGCHVATMHWRLHQARKILGRSLKRHLES